MSAQKHFRDVAARHPPARVERRDPEDCCDWKQAYSSMESAEKVARNMRRRDGFEPEKHRPLGPYKCPECGWWHVGKGAE